jgi:hypothetical protein
MTIEESLDKHVGISILRPYPNVKEAMKEYTKLKCEELLKTVAKKAKVNFNNKESNDYGVDVGSILNVVDLEEFII